MTITDLRLALVTPCEWTLVGAGLKSGCGKQTYWARLNGALFCPFCGHPILERHVEERHVEETIWINPGTV